MAIKTTADLIVEVKTQETIPDSGAAYSDADLLQYLNFGLTGIVAAIEATMEEYFVETKDFQFSTQQSVLPSGMPVDVNNTVDIPAIASGMSLRDVYLVGTNGSFINLPRLTPTQAASQSFYWWGNGSGSQGPQNNNGLSGFYLQGNQIQIFPYNLASDKLLRITFRRTPAQLCLIGSAAQVISKTGDVLTVGNVPNWTPAVTHLCAVSSAAPHPYVIDATVPVPVYTTPAYLDDFVPTAISGNVITLPTNLATNIQVGDWLCPSGYSVYVQNVPLEFYPSLVQKAGEMCLHAAGDESGTKMAKDAYVEMMKLALLQVAPRVVGKPIHILPINSPFRASRRNFFSR